MYYICCLCLFLFSKSLRVSEVFIQAQREHQQTWSAKPRDRRGGPCVHSCTRHSTVQLDLWPLGPSPSLCQLYLSFHCHPFLSSPGLAAGTQKVQSVIKTKGRKGPEGPGEVKAVPSHRWPHRSCQLIVAPLWRFIVTHPQEEEEPSSAGASFLEWWHSFCPLPDKKPRPDSSVGGTESRYTMEAPPSQMEAAKTVDVMMKIKMDKFLMYLMKPIP